MKKNDKFKIEYVDVVITKIDDRAPENSEYD